MFESNLYIIIYIALWVVTFFYFLKKKKVFGAGNFILASYVVYGVLSFFLFNNHYYQYTDNGKKLQLFPFIYLFLIMLLFLRPVLKYDETCQIKQPSEKLLNVFSYLFVISSILVLPFLLFNLVNGLTMIMLSDTGAEDLYSEAHDAQVSGNQSFLYTLVHTVFSLFTDMGILLFFINAIRPNAKKLLLIGMAIGIFIGMIEALSRGLRTELVMKFLMIVATYFLFRSHLPQKTNKKIKQAGYTLTGFVVFIVIIINVSRFSDRSYDSSFQLLNYSGQASLNFDKYALDAGGTRHGDRTFNYFKKWLRFKNVPASIYDTRTKYSNMKLDDSLFSTYVGDFVLDFGPVGAALILVLSSFLFTVLTRIKRNKICFHQLILLFFVTAICAQGGMYLFYYAHFRNYNIVYIILFYLIFKIDYDFSAKALKRK